MPRAPEFWNGRGAVSTVLLPVAWLLDLAGRARQRLVTPLRAGVPVLCVGAIDAGGAGKTPVAAALAETLRRTGHRPHILSRGYGGRLRGPLRVDPTRHEAVDCGDEPLLLARETPVWIGADRRKSAQSAIAAGADCLLLDDGFQNPQLAQDLRLVVLDGTAGFGNRRLLPAGPLRQSPARALRRATHALIMGADAAGLAAEITRIAPELPVLRARLAVPDAGRFAGRRVLGFAGIGRPRKFLATLGEIGCEVVGFEAFPDHHRYTPEQVMQLVEAAAAADATPVTTEKDRLRLPTEARRMVEAVPVRVVWEADADAGLAEALFAGRPAAR
jgi:tetraacyldisaccharide 4'-kinase